ncbi:MAG: hemerythrin domain-containing protein [Rubrivivax sp.]|nr:hemerythrin domain-containing protein [Rubrivivax sp.]
MSKANKKARVMDGFTRPSLPAIDALDGEHRQVMDALGDLARLIALLDSEGVTDKSRKLARHICTFFTQHAREHHAAEERLIFPGLLKSSDETLVQHVIRLQQDHGWLEEDWLELEPQLEAAANGFSWYDLDTLRAALPVFEQLYRDHIALEESLIYPEARRRQAVEDAAAEGRAQADVQG